MQVLVLRFDYKLSTKLEQDSNDLHLASSRSNETPLPPHISLFSFEQTNPLTLNERVEKWSDTQKQLTISLSSLGFFKQKGTFFVAPVVTKEIETFHRELFSLIMDLHTNEISPYLPGKWVPHSTLINNVPLTVWGPLFQRAALAFEPVIGKAVALECWTVINGRAQTEWTHFLQ
ncbi:MAG: 2'-5' RNA ligase family protein [Paenisporosarcina sp.]|uniref:2'-5' RNA ligase family protein n=1 Tax=Paenisporosarcina sp. TaxID=1932001 RepID=UPI003C723E54